MKIDIANLPQNKNDRFIEKRLQDLKRYKNYQKTKDIMYWMTFDRIFGRHGEA